MAFAPDYRYTCIKLLLAKHQPHPSDLPTSHLQALVTYKTSSISSDPLNCFIIFCPWYLYKVYGSGNLLYKWHRIILFLWFRSTFSIGPQPKDSYYPLCLSFMAETTPTKPSFLPYLRPIIPYSSAFKAIHSKPVFHVSDRQTKCQTECKLRVANIVQVILHKYQTIHLIQCSLSRATSAGPENCLL